MDESDDRSRYKIKLARANFWLRTPLHYASRLADANLEPAVSILNKSFTTGQVVHATGLPNATLQSWLKRGLLVGHRNPEEGHEVVIGGAGSSGKHRSFSFFSVMEIAVAKALTDVGLSAAHALQASIRFAHSARGPLGSEPFRMPSIPYDTRVAGGSKTLLGVAGDRSTVYRMAQATDPAYVMIRHELGYPEGFVVLDVTTVFERVVTALGHKHLDVYSEVFGPIKTEAQ